MKRTATVAAVYGTGLMQGLVVVSFPASGAILRAAHGFSDAQYGAIFLPQTALTILGSLAAGSLAQRIGLESLARLALVVGALAELLLAATALLSPGLAYVALLVAIGLAGLGFGLASAPINTFPGVLFPTRRDTALVLLHTLVGAGFAVGPLLAGAAVQVGAWAAFPVVLAALGLGFLFLPFPDAPAPAPRRTSSGPTRSVAFWSLVAVAVVYAICEGTFSNFVVLYLQEERAVPPAGAALALSTFWAALVVGRLVVSALVVRVPARWIWTLLPVLMVAAFLLLPRADSTASGIALFALAGVACSAFFPLTVGFASSRFPEHTAWVSSMLTAALMLGVGLGSFILGALRRATTLAALYRISSLDAVVVFALVLVVLVVTRLDSRNATKEN